VQSLTESSVSGPAAVAEAPTATTTSTTVDRPTAAPAATRSLRRRLLAPIGVSAALDINFALGDRLPQVDGLAYFEVGRNFLGGDGYTRAGAPELHFPPLVPVCLRGLELVTRSEMVALGTWNTLTSLAVLAALIGLAHRLWHDDRVTVAVAWLAGTTAGLGPLFFRSSSGSEAVSLALLLAAVLAALRGLDERSAAGLASRARWLALSGVLVGLAYLARPEALLPGLLVGVAAAAWAGHRNSRRASRLDRVPATGPGPVRRLAGAAVAWSRAGAVPVGAFVLGAAVLVAPYVIYLHSHTDSWELTAKTQDASIEAWRAVAEGHRLERDEYLYALGPDGTLGSDTKPLTTLAAEHPREWFGIVQINAGKLATSYLIPRWRWRWGLSWALLPAPLVALALVELWKQRHRRGTWLAAGVGLVPIGTCLVFFSQPRYLAVPTAVLALFAAKGLVDLHRRLPRKKATALVATVGLVMSMSLLTEARSLLPGGRTADPVDQWAAGKWIEANTPVDSRVMTRSFHVQNYAQRPVVALPVADFASTMDFARLMGVNYLVPDARSPLYARLLEGPPPPGLRAVALVGTSKRPIRIFQLDPAPPPSDRDPIPLGYVSD
jgi:hypothetical protein